MASVTAGPASAISISCLGSRGMRSSCATPPMGSSVMSRVPTPKRRAVSACPSSCATTDAKSRRMNSTPLSAACAVRPA